MKVVIIAAGIFISFVAAGQSTENTAQQQLVFDSVFHSGLNKQIYRGAAFVLVQDGKVIYQNGYGFFDMQKRIPVDPARSIFYTASVSKIFASLSLMQLQEKGRCTMNDNAAKYLHGLKIPGNYTLPVRLRNLVTHTAGFEDKFMGGMAKDASGLISLNTFFRDRMPAVVMEPGTQISYSNLGAALAGLIVQNIAGVTYDEYVQHKIFNVLDMRHSSFYQPVPDSLKQMLSPARFNQPLFNPYPAAACVTTAADMGKLIADLVNGSSKILSSESLQQIFSQQWSANTSMPGMGFGFMQSWRNGQQGYFHTGDAGQHSELFLLPEKKMGFYVVYTNLDENAENPRETLTRIFLNTYFPVPKYILPSSSKKSIAEQKKYEGSYRINAYARTNFEKIAILPMQASCKVNNDSSLQLSLFGGGLSVKLMSIGKDLFRGDDEAYYAFGRNKNGKVTTISISGGISDPTGLEKISWYDNILFHIIIIALSAIAVISRILISIIAVAKKVFRKSSLLSTGVTTTQKWIWRLPVIQSLLIMAVPVSGLIGIAVTSAPIFTMPFFLSLLLNLLVLVSMGGVIVAIATLVCWRDKYWTISKRLYYSFFSISMLLLSWFIFYWQL